MIELTKKIIRLLFLALALTLTAVSASADPLTITSGSLTITGMNDSASAGWNITAPNFSMGSGGASYMIYTAAGRCPYGLPDYQCAAGTAINLGGHVQLDSTDFSGSFLFSGNQYVIEFMNGGNASFNMTTGSTLIPTGNSFSVVVTAPFSLTGSVAGRNSQGFGGIDLVGGGTAYLYLNQSDSRYRFDHVTYVFATPEPATLVLFTTVLAGFLWRRRSHRK